MTNRVCFFLPGKRVCITIPVAGPVPHLPVPDPGPWIQVQDVNPELMRDIETLAQMQALSERLSASIATSVSAALRAGVAKLKESLPKGVELTIETSR